MWALFLLLSICLLFIIVVAYSDSIVNCGPLKVTPRPCYVLHSRGVVCSFELPTGLPCHIDTVAFPPDPLVADDLPPNLSWHIDTEIREAVVDGILDGSVNISYLPLNRYISTLTYPLGQEVHTEPYYFTEKSSSSDSWLTGTAIIFVIIFWYCMFMICVSVYLITKLVVS